jgi:hypothetical protein
MFFTYNAQWSENEITSTIYDQIKELYWSIIGAYKKCIFIDSILIRKFSGIPKQLWYNADSSFKRECDSKITDWGSLYFLFHQS